MNANTPRFYMATVAINDDRTPCKAITLIGAKREASKHFKDATTIWIDDTALPPFDTGVATRIHGDWVTFNFMYHRYAINPFTGGEL